uniref:Uncharacterized protein n=1 Tax=Ditylenchus dipsaci TaxID=166011 RepID=A0A915D8J2_9BILA
MRSAQPSCKVIDRLLVMNSGDCDNRNLYYMNTTLLDPSVCFLANEAQLNDGKSTEENSSDALLTCVLLGIILNSLLIWLVKTRTAKEMKIMDKYCFRLVLITFVCSYLLQLCSRCS